jgi:RNA polymerase sigma-70 factor (ECF subfamily)
MLDSGGQAGLALIGLSPIIRLGVAIAARDTLRDWARGERAMSHVRGEQIDKHLPAAKAGSSKALGEVLEASRRYLLWVARHELEPDLQAKAGASDMVQMTFLEAQRDFGQFMGKTEAEFLAWLRRLLANNLANFARDYRQTAKRNVRQERSLSQSDGMPDTDLATRTPTPSGILMRGESNDIIRQALATLPENYRRVLTLWQEEDRSFADIGKMMNRKPNAARMLWVRALKQLHQLLEARSQTDG